MLRRRLMILRPLLKQVLRSHRNLCLARRRKLKKALADANKEHAQREQAVAERLHTMSTAAESRCFSLSSIFDFYCTVVLVDTCLFFSFLFSFYCVEFTEISPSSLQTDDDHLMTAVNLLEAKWISI
jgi:hypothetical protein